MENINYTKFSEDKKIETPVVEETIVEEEVEVTETETPEVEEPVVEETEEKIEEEEVEETEEPVIGVVVNCSRLNVRGKASTDAEVLKIIDAGAQVKIYEEESTEEFYKVLSGGIVGFCMKEFIEI